MKRTITFLGFTESQMRETLELSYIESIPLHCSLDLNENTIVVVVKEGFFHKWLCRKTYDKAERERNLSLMIQLAKWKKKIPCVELAWITDGEMDLRKVQPYEIADVMFLPPRLFICSSGVRSQERKMIQRQCQKYSCMFQRSLTRRCDLLIIPDGSLSMPSGVETTDQVEESCDVRFSYEYHLNSYRGKIGIQNITGESEVLFLSEKVRIALCLETILITSSEFKVLCNCHSECLSFFEVPKGIRTEVGESKQNNHEISTECSTLVVNHRPVFTFSQVPKCNELLIKLRTLGLAFSVQKRLCLPLREDCGKFEFTTHLILDATKIFWSQKIQEFSRWREECKNSNCKGFCRAVHVEWLNVCCRKGEWVPCDPYVLHPFIPPYTAIPVRKQRIFCLLDRKLPQIYSDIDPYSVVQLPDGMEIEVVRHPEECTHFISLWPSKSENFLCCMSLGCVSIVPPSFIGNLFLPIKGKVYEDMHHEWSTELMTINNDSRLKSMRTLLGSVIQQPRQKVIHPFGEWRVLLCCRSRDRTLKFNHILECGGCGHVVSGTNVSDALNFCRECYNNKMPSKGHIGQKRQNFCCVFVDRSVWRRADLYWLSQELKKLFIQETGVCGDDTDVTYPCQILTMKCLVHYLCDPQHVPKPSCDLLGATRRMSFDVSRKRRRE